MSSFQPFLVKLYWNGETSYVNGVVDYDEATLTTSFIIRYRITYQQLVDEVYNHVQIVRQNSQVNLLLYYSFQGFSESSFLVGEESMNMLYFLSENVVHFMAHIKVNWQSFILSQHSSCMDLLRGFSSSYAGGVDNTTALQDYNTEVGVALLDQQVNEHYESDGFEHSEGHMTNESEESEFPPSNDESEGEGEDQIPFSSEQYNSGVYQGFSQSFDLNEPIEESDDNVLPDFDDEDHMDV
ncbi:hypothetical protein E3N88_34288 [Mikania micrantha]|uniref:Uncharacterized protein n=1 Tax=Mikania micrantha TaxID=192012 RepID=A0A5N6LXV8_9ASTR|nr:hypothetical protein E3N88_34288 [Mikania micrantha]